MNCDELKRRTMHHIWREVLFLQPSACNFCSIQKAQGYKAAAVMHISWGDVVALVNQSSDPDVFILNSIRTLPASFLLAAQAAPLAARSTLLLPPPSPPFATPTPTSPQPSSSSCSSS